MTVPLVLNHDCVACQCRALREDGELAALCLLMTMANTDQGAEDVIQQLCFAHRRRIEDGFKRAAEQAADLP